MRRTLRSLTIAILAVGALILTAPAASALPIDQLLQQDLLGGLTGGLGGLGGLGG